MQKLAISKRLAGRQFNTLAQSETKKVSYEYDRPLITVCGKGSDITDEKGLKNQSKKKQITQALTLSLIDIARSKGNARWKNPYGIHIIAGLKYTAIQVGYLETIARIGFVPFVVVIEKAELIRKYLPVLQTWPDPQFVTLTVRAPKIAELNKFIKGVLRAFKKIERRLRKRFERGTGIKLIGIKSIECNFNPKARTYNPHLHLIVQTKEMAEVLVKEWLSIWTTKHTSPKAQLIIPISDREQTLIEIIKYGTKIFTEPDPHIKNCKGSQSIYTAALYNILLNMKGVRLFDRFGFNLSEEVYSKGNKESILDYEIWKYNSSINDWENENNQKLTGYLPSSELIELLMNNIDRIME